MRTHLIIDFMHLVFRARYVKTYLSSVVNDVEETEQDGVYKVRLFNKDFYYSGSSSQDEGYGAITVENGKYNLRTTVVYMVIKYLEGIIREFEKQGRVDVTICFDAGGNQRKEENKEYKANRDNHFSSDEVTDIDLIQTMLQQVGYNCLKVSGYEADDLVYWANIKYRGEYDQTIILTNDMDLMYNVGGSSKLYIRRIKDRAYKIITESNASDFCSDVYKVNMPYSSIMLFKSLVGDRSDGIKGVKGYGNVAFGRMIESTMKNSDFDFNTLLDWHNVAEFISQMQLTDVQKQEALSALELVRPRDIDTDLITAPLNVSIEDKRRVYSVLNIKLY